jgi:DNA-binding FrmR family transcriptional regulator
MSTATVPMTRQRGVSRRQEEEVLSRLRKATGQLAGVTSMYADGRYCIDVLDQLSAVTAAVDAVAVLILTDHINACVRAAIDTGDTERTVADLVTAVRRYVRSQ